MAMTLAPAVLAPASGTAASRVHLDGRGFGHGIGLSQYGAKGFAERGRDYRSILAHYYTGTSLGTLEDDREVRVLVRGGAGAVELRGASDINGLRTDPGRPHTIRTSGGRLVIARGGRAVGTVDGFVRAVGPGPITVAGTGTYRGAIEVRPGLDVINALPFDDYVRGVISAEMPASWPLEALKAQAVAARSYAVTTSKQGAGFEHYADTRSQVYRGVAAETARTDRAVTETARQVVTHRGRPVTTYFFSTSGGMTENVEFSFVGAPPRPWLKGVEDPFEREAGSPRHKWRLPSLTLPAAQRRLGGLVKGRLRGIEVVKRGASPRVVHADLIGTGGRTRVDGPTLKARFGLPDTWVSLTTISAAPGPRPPREPQEGAGPPGGGAGPPGGGAAPALGAALATLRRPGVSRTLVGEAHPAQRGAMLLAQRRVLGGWRPVARVALQRGGRFAAGLPGPGTYRMVHGRRAGPPVRIR